MKWQTTNREGWTKKRLALLYRLALNSCICWHVSCIFWLGFFSICTFLVFHYFWMQWITVVPPTMVWWPQSPHKTVPNPKKNPVVFWEHKFKNQKSSGAGDIAWWRDSQFNSEHPLKNRIIYAIPATPEGRRQKLQDQITLGSAS